jgi:hypothetical protein
MPDSLFRSAVVTEVAGRYLFYLHPSTRRRRRKLKKKVFCFVFERLGGLVIRFARVENVSMATLTCFGFDLEKRA